MAKKESTPFGFVRFVLVASVVLSFLWAKLTSGPMEVKGALVLVAGVIWVLYRIAHLQHWRIPVVESVEGKTVKPFTINIQPQRQPKLKKMTVDMMETSARTRTKANRQKVKRYKTVRLKRRSSVVES